MALAQCHVQAGIHARSTQDVVEHKERYASRVVDVEGAVAHHHVGLVGMALAHDGLPGKRLHEWRWNGRKWLALGTLGTSTTRDA